MNLKKSLIIGVSTLALAPVASATIASSAVYADEINQEAVLEEQYEVSKNELYVELENEVNQLENSGKTLTDEEITNLLHEYEGASATLILKTNGNSNFRAASASGVSYQVVNGGVNSFATNKEAMSSLAGTFKQQQQAIIVGGTAAGAPFAGFGILLSGLASSAVSGKFGEASSIMDRWYESSATQGGVRMTVTEQRPISSPTATAKATIP